jgi:RND family efflux transporter MFP subunit
LNKKFGVFLLLLAGAAFVVWKLADNKRILAAEAALSRVRPSFVPVEVIAPQMESLASRLETDGIFLPSKEMFIISETAGRVVQTYKNKGEWVKEGEVIAKVDDEMLHIELAATQANLAKLRRDKDRLENLIEGEAAPKNKMEDVDLGVLAAEAKEKGLNKQISNTSIRAPMTGTLGLRFIERGSVIGPGIQVGQMTNLERLFLMVKVTERDILLIRKGATVAVLPDVYAGLSLTGRVTNIGLRADNTFNYDVEIEVANPDKNPLRGGMHAKAIFNFDSKRQGMTLPRKAVTGSLQEATVYVLRDSTVAVRPVELGMVTGDRVEIRAGLTTDDQVVVSGQSGLAEGVRVRVVRKNE